ncbi:vacuolar protein sorting-associated protein VTA1 homolog isoform X2 [Bacillus rossius redtenbacheri]|uniref:vacuolar protein sorting-associated protein VTA1 homolog isoform X2 n=1 Tax=Bacillus rossius redtenbacheri TaxID=93214 RepID=UPI002FDECC96
MVLNLPPLPDTLKQIQRFLNVANQFEQRDIAVAYWSRLHALQLALKMDRKSKEAQAVSVALLDWLEKEKKGNQSSEIRQAAAAKTHLEEIATRLLEKAYELDLAEQYGKPIIHYFYTAGVLFDVMQQFGELSEEATQKRKYAKWKSVYISGCLKSGETPVPGPPGEQGAAGGGKPWDDDDEMELQSFLGGHEKPGPEKPAGSGASHVSPVQPTSDFTPSPSTGGEGASSSGGPSSSFVASEEAGGTGGVKLTPELTLKAQKYCKWAESALSYSDEPTAIDYLTKALKLVRTGVDE